MSLIQLALQNIPSSKLSELTEKFGISQETLSSGLGVLSGAVLTALKAGLLQNPQNAQAITGTSDQAFSSNLMEGAFQSLFGGNKHVEGVLTEKVSAATGLGGDGASALIQQAAPLLGESFQALLQNLPGFLTNKSAGSSEGEGVFAADGYQDALQSANQFLQSVFGKSAFSAASPEANTGSGLFSGLLNMIDADDDGQVMDDIFQLLVK